MTTDYDPSLVHLPGTKLTPEVVLHRTMNKLERIKAVLVAIILDDETVDLDWSNMTSGQIASVGMAVHDNATKIVMGEHKDAIWAPKEKA